MAGNPIGTVWLDPPVSPERDRYLGSVRPSVTIVEYGSYDCLRCRAAGERIGDLRDEWGDSLAYVFRQRPLVGNDLARRAAALAQKARTADEFWRIHDLLMHRSERLSEEDLAAVALELGEPGPTDPTYRHRMERALARVEQDE